MKSVYVVTYDTESGDSGVLAVYDRKPTKAELLEAIRQYSPDEIDIRTGDLTMYWEVQKKDIVAPPPPLEDKFADNFSGFSEPE
jgi:hypothetical protein